MKDVMTGSETGAAGLALIKIYGAKALLGMIGAAMLYVVLPPTDNQGRFSRREFVARLAIAGIFSCMFGDWLYTFIISNFPWLHAHDQTKAIDMMAGAPGWWITRLAAKAMHNRQDHDIVQVIQEVRGK